VTRHPYLVVLAAVVCVSSGSILVRLAQAPALAVAFYRVALASLLVSPFALRPLADHVPRMPSGQLASLLGAGLALGIHFATWIESLSLTSIASSVLIVNAAPVVTLLLSRIVLKETPPKAVLVAIAIALAGVLRIAWGDWGGGRDPVTGDLLAFAGAVSLSVYHVIGRGLRQALPLGAYILGVWATSALVLAVLATLLGVHLTGYPPRTAGVFLALALIPTIAGHGLVNLSLRLLPAPTVGLFLLGEPVGASILAYLLFAEVPTSSTLTGGAVVLLGLALATRGGGR
jgi:drug/metabolite transporter (DMT)-like permease